MAKIKVLHIITELPVGGAQDNTLATCELLDKEKYDITLLSSPGGVWEPRARAIEGIQLNLTNLLKRQIVPFIDFLAFIEIFWVILRGKYHIVHTHSSKPGFLGRVAARLVGVPIIIHTIHGFPFNDFMSPFKRNFFIFLERMAEKCDNKLITVSKLNLEKAVELKLAQREKFVNIYSGIDLSRFDQHMSADDIQKKRKELSIPDGRKVVAMIGRLSPQKAPHYYIQAAAIILKKRQDVQFLLVGDGELRDDLEKQVKKAGIGDNVSFLGSRGDIPEILSVMDVFALSSLWEGLGRSMTEAMAMGKPVIANAVEGVPELVENGKTGILVSPKNVEALAEGIEKLLTDEAWASELGKNARERVRKDFCVKKMVEDIDHLYDELIEQKNLTIK